MEKSIFEINGPESDEDLHEEKPYRNEHKEVDDRQRVADIHDTYER